MNRRRSGPRAYAWLIAFALGFSATAHAQRPNENAVAEASDAFGTAIGREVIGLYTTTSARGFSPSQAGNLRISGLYFDQISSATPVNRIIRGSTVHVGISAQGFPFPAPTGVVDFQLRTPGNESSASALVGLESYEQSYAELDAQTPLVEDVLSVGGGFGFAHNGDYKGAQDSTDWNAGAIAHWQPTSSLSITPFWGASRHRESGEKPNVFIGSSGYPRLRMSELPGQEWARWNSNSNTFGTTVRYAFAEGWLLDVGLFHSQFLTQTNNPLYLENLGPSNIGDYAVAAVPPRNNNSTSGEARLSKRIDTENVRNTLYLSVKGRDRNTESGGVDKLSLGTATTTFAMPIARPELHPGSTTRVKAEQTTPAIAYEGVWRNVGQLSVGLQKSYYERETGIGGPAPVSSSSAPWLYNVAATFYFSKKLVAYTSTTRGFEEIGDAPINAANRDQPVPAQLTKQVDAGIKYQFRPSLQLVAGVFEIQKPYFDLDQTAIYRRVGDTSNRGAELSLSGALTERLTVVAGYIYIDPKVKFGAGISARDSAVAVGPIPGLFRANFQYRPAALSGLILDAKVESTSARYARYDSINLPAVTTFDVGARYNTHLLGKPATYRFQLYNLSNEYALTPSASGQLQPFDGRHFELSLAFDL